MCHEFISEIVITGPTDEIKNILAPSFIHCIERQMIFLHPQITDTIFILNIHFGYTIDVERLICKIFPIPALLMR